MSMRRWVVLLFVVALTVPASTARAQDQPASPESPAEPSPEPSPEPEESAPPTPAPPSEGDERLEKAKELFRKGNALRRAGELESALQLFLQSRAVLPSVPNTLNAAVALHDLGRFDEAQELYEEVLKDFEDKLTPSERQSIAAALTSLRAKVGSVDVGANVQGDVIIDGRKRATLPLTKPIRVLPGRHQVRVLKEGYNPAEAEVKVEAGKTASVDLRLAVLASAGRLKVTDANGAPDVELLVDGAPVGLAPWEGTLKPGRHLVALRGKKVGTAPQAVTVLVGQTLGVRLRSEPVGPETVLEPEPSAAVLWLDKTKLGAGTWRGSLPRRPFTVTAREEGYRTKTLQVDGRAGGEVSIRLKVDPEHPRWQKAASAKIAVELVGGMALGTGMGGDAESSCPDACTKRRLPFGGLVGLRGAYVLPMGLQVDVGGGYLHLSTEIDRTVDSGLSHVYVMEHAIVVTGPYAAVGLRYNHSLMPKVRLNGGVSVGAFFAASKDGVTGSAVRGQEATQVYVESSGEWARGVDFFVLPEVGADLVFGQLHVGAGLAVGIFLLDGPVLPNGETRPVPGDCPPGSTAIWCIQSNDEITVGQRAYSQFLLWIPRVTAGWTF